MNPYIKGRDPYTYAADFLRGFCTDGAQIAPGITSCSMSRATASQVRKAIALEIGMDDAELAAVLARAYMRKHNISPT